MSGLSEISPICYWGRTGQGTHDPSSWKTSWKTSVALRRVWVCGELVLGPCTRKESLKLIVANFP